MVLSTVPLQSTSSLPINGSFLTTGLNLPANINQNYKIIKKKKKNYTFWSRIFLFNNFVKGKEHSFGHAKECDLFKSGDNLSHATSDAE